MADTRLTIVAQYDDIVRNRNILSEGIEAEFLKFVWNQESCRKQWLEADKCARGLRSRIESLETENATLQTKLKHARNQIDHEMRKRVKAEQDRDSLERQVVLVRELLSNKTNQSMLNEKDREKLAFLSTDFQVSNCDSPGKRLATIEESASLLSPSDISYDKTEDDLDASYQLRSGQKYKRRPSAPPLEDEDTPPDKKHRQASPPRKRRSKKHRRSRSAVITTTSVTVQDGHVEAQAEIATDRRKRLQKYPSAGNLKAPDSEEERSPRGHGGIGGIGTRTPSSSSLHHYGSTKSLNRPHSFVTKTVIKPEQCVWCGKKIKFGKAAMKCKDCRATAHPECKDQVPLPCVPATVTPINEKGTIADHAPADPPMIPALVIHCANEVEHRGLTEKGIYRVPGSEREIKDLRDKFHRGKGGPNLSQVNDINVVCGCLKDFLRSLKEPLVSQRLWPDFVRAAELPDLDEALAGTYQAISQLPRPNRDTIAFIIRHLQRVSESEHCAMGTSNLAKVFGPTIVGYSSADPEPMQMISETKKQQMVMECLLHISNDYWENFLNIEDDAMPARDFTTPQTPEGRPAPYSILGPLSNTGDIERKNSWFTPKFGSKKSSVKAPTQFFASPQLR